MPQIKEQKNQEAIIIVRGLYEALIIYQKKVGTYEVSVWKNTNERKIASSIKIITSLLSSFERYKNLTPAQIKLARKLISNSKKLA